MLQALWAARGNGELGDRGLGFGKSKEAGFHWIPEYLVGVRLKKTGKAQGEGKVRKDFDTTQRILYWSLEVTGVIGVS